MKEFRIFPIRLPNISLLRKNPEKPVAYYVSVVKYT